MKKAAPRGGLCVVGDTGIEPVTSSVSGKRATAAPIAHARWVRDSNPCIRLCRPLPRLSANPPYVPTEIGGVMRADDGTRTRDPHLGKVMLYQLSHVRMARDEVSGPRKTIADAQAHHDHEDRGRVVQLPSTWQAGSKKATPRGGFRVVGDTGIEPVTSSVSGKRATAAPIARGGYGIRTRVYGFAGRCLASRPTHRGRQ